MPYLTPDEAAVRVKSCRRFTIYSEYWPYLIGAMVDLLAVRHWEESGDITPDQAVQEISQMFIDGIGSGYVIGEICALATAALPDFMIACDGASRLRVDYPDLYAALDAAFIVDADHFVTPDLRGRVPMGSGTGSSPALSPRTMNTKVGSERHTLSVNEIPSHNHSVIDPGLMAVTVVPAEGFALADPGLPTVTGSSGGGVGHNNIQPSMVCRFGIVYR